MIYIFLVGVVCFGIAFILRRASVLGSIGELKVALRLRRALDPDIYTIFHEVLLPSRGGTTQIDHVIVSRFGIFVIETKNMSGWIFGGADQKSWTQSFPRKKLKFQNPLRQNYRHLRTLEDVLAVPRAALHNVVVFVGPASPKTKMPDNVLWNTRDLAEFVLRQGEPVFSQAEVNGLCRRLNAAQLVVNRAAKRTHRENLQRERRESRHRSFRP
ncbi:MAG: nuclease-related domain-containing protein [Pseudoruegeria sp.]